jgi:hypothetical protein
MTALECRKILGVDKGMLVAWEQGRHKPSRENRERIARFLGGLVRFEPKAIRACVGNRTYQTVVRGGVSNAF